MSEQKLIMAAAMLSRSAPNEWKHFLGALEDYSNLVSQQCVQSPLAELPRAQGHAQQAARLKLFMEECRQRADKIEGKRK